VCMGAIVAKPVSGRAVWVQRVALHTGPQKLAAGGGRWRRRGFPSGTMQDTVAAGMPGWPGRYPAPTGPLAARRR